MKRKFEVFNTGILVGILGSCSSLISCTPSPEWVRSEIDKVKVTLIAPTANETKLGNANGITVFISVVAESTPSSIGMPMSRTGNGNLGAKLQINRPNISYEQASLNIDHCIGISAEQGVIQSLASGPSSQGGFYMEFKYQSIEPFVNRFTDCLKNLGYSTRNDNKKGSSFIPDDY